ncbi:Malonyl-CoA\\x3aanthocyanidin 5-O-glucoside-6-O-malonyltransferase [Striga hermonthica]|uniref:Malonyl-CoA\x3aanthocyanidin 5-O-glucoside-6-O-malonyltransferase n=1 Tax=Striga hermonthica TaxID=68872 RepID=A0A9N7NU89_STRHE|nr:Malonyl-CoA\\x3aanthocyanidin 5-O-glucoside-6-O-malonyltransferase [Striga hermonthica]
MEAFRSRRNHSRWAAAGAGPGCPPDFAAHLPRPAPFPPDLPHFLLRFPLSQDTENYKPTIRYSPGDSVQFSIYESSVGGEIFDSLVGNQPRDADAFYDYTPQLPPVITEPDCKLIRLLAVQVTLFPGRGVCVGVTNHHSADDASSIVGFVRAWASACRSGSLENARPVFDRGLIVDPSGRLESAYWDQMKRVPLTLSPFPLPTNRVRATYIFYRARIEKLKDSVVANLGFMGLDRPSSFVAASAHTRYRSKCLIKVNTLLLTVPLSHKASLVPSNLS